MFPNKTSPPQSVSKTPKLGYKRAHSAENEDTDEVMDIPRILVNDPTTWPSDYTQEDIKKLIESSGQLNNVTPDYLAIHMNFSIRMLSIVNILLAEILVQRETPESIRNRCPRILDTFPIMASSTNSAMLVARSNDIKSDHYVDIYDIEAPYSDAVLILSGESGIGKTVGAIASVCPNRHDLRFFCLASDISTFDITAANRDEECIKGLMAAMRKCHDVSGKECDFLSDVRIADSNDMKFTVGIVVDEAGNHPRLVRALCSVAKLLATKLELKNVTVCVAVAGTGVLSGYMPPGSHPSSFVARVLRVSKTTYWDAIAKSIPDVLKSLITEHPRAKSAICNPRFARLLLREIQKTPSEATLAMSSDTVLTTFLGTWLENAASYFKKLNGLCDVEASDLLNVLGSALHLVLFCNTPPTQAIESIDGEDPTASRYRSFITRYGMVVDNAKWVPANKVGVDDLWATSKGTCSLVSVKGERFTLSIAQTSILMLLLGLVPDRSSINGESLESCVASLLPLLISAFRTRTVGEMLAAVGVTCDDSTVIPNGPMTVNAVQYHDDGCGMLDSVAANYNSDSAYVVTNGPKYPFADIVVLIPMTVMLLIQCKDYNDPLESSKVKGELAKMCHPSYKKDSKMDTILSHFNIQKVVYAFIGSNAEMIKERNSEEPVTSDSILHIVCFGGLSGVKEPLRSIIAFNANQRSGCSNRVIGELPTMVKMCDLNFK